MNEDVELIKNRIKSKRLSKINEKPKDSKIKYFKNLLSRTLIAIILVLISIIYINFDDKNLSKYKNEVFTNNISFATIKNTYNKYLGEVIPLDIKEESSTSVFGEELVYKNIEKFHNGYKLTVNNNEIIKNITSGIVVYIGEKENYGNVIIVQCIDGVDIWYGNITNTNLTLYDYIEEGTVLGEAKNDSLYVVLAKSGEYLNYEEYINKNKD